MHINISAIVLTVPMGLPPTATTTPRAPPTIIHTVVIRTPFQAATLVINCPAHRGSWADALSHYRYSSNLVYTYVAIDLFSSFIFTSSITEIRCAKFIHISRSIRTNNLNRTRFAKLVRRRPGK